MGSKPGPPIQRIPLLGVSPEESLDSPIDRRSDYYRQRAREERPSGVLQQQSRQAQPLLTAPNLLTFLRVLLVPVLVVLWFHPHRLAPLMAAITFIVAAITDWADGYLARRMKVTTAFGAFLDPVADKIMVSTVLVLLAVSPPEPLSHKDLAIPVVIMIGREITMSALREWAASSGGGAHKAVKVNSLGKWKTALQMAALSALLLLHKAHNVLGRSEEVLEALHWAARAALIVLWAGAFLAVWSLSNYMANVWTYFRYPNGLASPQNSPRPMLSPRLGSLPARKKSM
ncbi:CDP-diacylglycerol--glycerol-3-phosphate 3-phosphatidyltransferase [Coccomyxa subellipsoidea C-169]|uniref:CDP-diacylglycerol--glycerol-3-phosphate 3-phosphatidyltransferase n=1 Tax=Coccomyxa subellipsoidea (strain C-169) TaxID=574566 RepID=I0YME2_COCSC|nr:CDP-diacylglycerol--glycerol-3-phosphate 3-phosphatidyltransferase [Coccomyxa subellipsoidea C-169]EIE19561.1 CDP-diacylglycerol--glycerol-3-phosphate 3-phosphatidyltransferase [Coccomyxa subellipsoidea C-169]|eukprot:XP_005644105.1 CDP-diacylglycerol--glycerol-3-phosphate 3-phosphatidyltransferase [Coccomyxa subellipsoidea C-169]